MKQVALRVVVAVVMFLLAAPAAAQQPTGPKDRGFALEAQLGTRLVTVNVLGSPPLNVVDGGFFAGYKFGRWQIGGSIDFARVSYSDGTSTADSLLTIMPGVRVAILRSADERVELFGQVDLGYGHIFVDHNNGDPDHNRVIYQLGPGLRLWFHPNFAVGALVGLRGEFDIQEGNGGTTTGLTSIFARVMFTGVF